MKLSAAFALLALLAVAAGDVIGKAPEFCRGSPCPHFKTTSQAEGFDVRVYEESSTWASLNISGVDSSVELALTKASVPLERYIKGKNSRGESITSGRPVVVHVTPKNKFTELENDFDVAFYLPNVTKESAPKPNYTDITIREVPSDMQLYVYSFGGFATTSSILSSAAKLATALDRDKLSYDSSSFIFALYDAPYHLTNRHNEIWMAPKWRARPQATV